MLQHISSAQPYDNKRTSVLKLRNRTVQILIKSCVDTNAKRQNLSASTAEHPSISF